MCPANSLLIGLHRTQPGSRMVQIQAEILPIGVVTGWRSDEDRVFRIISRIVACPGRENEMDEVVCVRAGHKQVLGGGKEVCSAGIGGIELYKMKFSDFTNIFVAVFLTFSFIIC